MLIINLDGNRVKWKVNGKEVIQDNRIRSSLHIAARQLIKDRFPTMQVLEEVSIPLRRGKTLYLDFYIPLRKLAIEVHGEQHYRYSTLFHSCSKDFLDQRINDRDKELWCRQNNIEYIVLPYNTIDTWSSIL